MTLTRLWCYDDSITAEPNVAGLDYSYTSKLANRKGWLKTNLAQNGSMVADVYPKLFLIAPASDDVISIMIGTNDERIYETDATKLANYKTMLAAIGFYLTNDVSLATGWTQTGTWAAVAGQILGLYSSSAGSTLSTSFSGGECSFSYLMDDAVSGSFSVSIDGVSMGTFSTLSPAAILTSLGRNSGPVLKQFTGLGSGSHTLEVTVISGTVYIEWAAGAGSANGASLVLCSVPRMVAGVPGIGYEEYGGSDANVATYNAAIAAVATQLGASFADTGSVIDPYEDLYSDGVHPLAQGHDDIHAMLYATVG